MQDEQKRQDIMMKDIMDVADMTRTKVEETSDRMKELARRESALIIEDAKRNANAIIHEALVEAEKTELEVNMIRKNIKVYKNRVTSLLQSQLEIADELDKIEI